MSRCWQRSGLRPGELVKLPEKVVTSTMARLVSATYLSETSSGMLFRLEFMPSWGSEEPDMWHYNVFIDFAAVYSGHVKVVGEHLGELTVKKRIAGMRI